MIPVTHKEYFLATLAGEEVELPPPVDREEIYLAILCGESIDIPVPVTVDEMYLAALCGMDIELPPPVTRLQMIWAGILGEIEQEIIPVTREEYYWHNYEGGGTIQTVTGVSPLLLEAALPKPIKSLVQYGKCAQASTPTPSAPVDIVCNNGTLKYGALGQNLLDPSAANTVLEYYINKADGEVKPSPPDFMFANYMPVVGGKTYVAYGRAKTGNDLSDYNRVAWYDSAKAWISGADYTQNRIAVVTAPSNAAYARFSCNPTGTTTTTVTRKLVDSYNWMFAEGTAEITPFVPFEGGIFVDGADEVLTVSASGADPQTASVVNLYSAGDYADTQDIISGTIHRNVHVIVCDGTEDWRRSMQGSMYRYRLQTTDGTTAAGATRYNVFCSHFADTLDFTVGGCLYATSGKNLYCIPIDQTIDDAVKWKAWVAAQYAAGTPLIIIYPIDNGATESVTAQPLQTSAGDNTVSVTAEVSPIQLEVVFKGE